jgi:hypothetical protein
MHGFDSANSPYRLRNHHWKLSRCLLRNHQQNCFHWWHMDSTGQTVPMASEISNATTSTGDAWIRQRKQPCGLRNHQRNRFHRWRMDSTALTTPVDSEIITDNWVVADSKIINQTASTVEEWIRHRKEPLWAQKLSTKSESLPTQKSSMKLLPQVTHGFDSANIPCGLRIHQQNCFQG